jgi:hypothetical protein
MTLTDRTSTEPTSPSTRRGSVRVTAVAATLGVGFIALQVWIYGGWILSGDASEIRALGPVPTSARWTTIVVQLVLITVSVITITQVVRRCRREHRLTFDARLLIAWASVMWGDLLENGLEVTRLTSSYGFNLGTWAEHVPGWQTEAGGRVPQALGYSIPLYFSYGLLAALGVAWLIGRIRLRRPRWGLARVLLTVYPVILVIDTIAETLWVRTRAMIYPGSVRELSLFPGTINQVPLYVAALVALSLLGLGALKAYCVDDVQPVEAGAERLTTSARGRSAVRVLALVGTLNVICLAAYHVPTQLFATRHDPYPEDIPGYLLNGVCGGRSGIDCDAATAG